MAHLFGVLAWLLHSSVLLKSKYTMVGVSVAQSMYAFDLIAEYKNQNPIFHSILKWFNPLIGFLLVALLMLILFALLALVALIIWALFMVEALFKAFQEFIWLLHQVKQIMRSYFHRRRREENGSTILVGKEFKCCLSEVDFVLLSVDLLLWILIP